jgi:hypothetical protein
MSAWKRSGGYKATVVSPLAKGTETRGSEGRGGVLMQ